MIDVQSEKTLQAVDNMESEGGSFVKAIAHAFYRADGRNKQRLVNTFYDYFISYGAETLPTPIKSMNTLRKTIITNFCTLANNAMEQDTLTDDLKIVYLEQIEQLKHLCLANWSEMPQFEALNDEFSNLNHLSQLIYEYGKA